MRGHAHNGPNGGSGNDASATKTPPEAAAAPPLLPVALAEVLGQQTAHLHAKHAVQADGGGGAARGRGGGGSGVRAPGGPR